MVRTWVNGLAWLGEVCLSFFFFFPGVSMLLMLEEYSLTVWITTTIQAANCIYFQSSSVEATRTSLEPLTLTHFKILGVLLVLFVHPTLSSRRPSTQYQPNRLLRCSSLQYLRLLIVALSRLLDVPSLAIDSGEMDCASLPLTLHMALSAL